MQSAETNTKLNRGFLLLALRRYSAAVHNMEQTVLLPSLLRDVESDSDEDEDCFQDCHSAAESSCKDLYDYYLMLKAIRNTVESGLVPLDDRKQYIFFWGGGLNITKFYNCQAVYIYSQ
uniref:Thyroid hormone responsive n=1 Tax=Hucho hucho TaxID=62062 RepID=A0A4W5KWW7_9TELE